MGVKPVTGRWHPSSVALAGRLIWRCVNSVFRSELCVCDKAFFGATTVAKIDTKKKFGTVVRDWRNQLGITQENLAERADLPRTCISDVERGTRNISLQSIAKLASALEISISALFPEDVKISRADGADHPGRRQQLVNVLLVEDDSDDVELTLRAFKQARFTNRVRVVNDGARALDFIFRRREYARRRIAEHPQLILLDLNLPKVSGVEVLRQIKADKRTWMIPVVILTVAQNINEIAECRRLGAERFIAKPVDLQRWSLITPHLNFEWALVKPTGASARNVPK